MQKKDLIMSIDSGTQSCRAIVWDTHGNSVSEGRAEHHIITPRLGWYEQDANEWWPAACASIRQSLEKVEATHIQALCISHQRETFVPVGKDGNPLRNALPHMDMRCESQVRSVIEKLGSENVQEITGKYPSYIHSLYKILWIMENEPDVYNKVYKFMDVQGFLLTHLIDKHVTSYVSADSMSLIDIRSKGWSKELMKSLGLKPEHYLDLCDPGRVIGRITKTASQETGLPERLPVVAGAGDGICAALGTRTIAPDRAFFIIGTWTALGGYSTRYVVDRSFRTLVSVIPGSYHLEANVAGGYIVRWFLDNYSKDPASEPEEYWEKIVSQIPPGSEGLLTIPYWFGSLAPYWDNTSRGITIGWAGIHTRGHMYRSILEGVSFEHRMLLEAMASALNAKYREIAFVGGGAKSPLWSQITSDVFALPICVTSTVESSSLGAAIIGATGLGIYQTFEEAADKMTSLEIKYRPNSETTDIYDRLFEVYKNIFPGVREEIHRLYEIVH
jgi:sugar (pentulose or hexulose) kinase